MQLSTIDVPADRQRERPGLAVISRDPLVLAITALTLLGLGLRLIYLLHDGYLSGVTEYDDGAYFGSAVRLTQGVLPYRDFVLVHPPGITLLMAPSALLAKVAGTGAGLVSGRILEALAGAASIALTGLLVRHWGLLAVVISGGLMAVYPEAVAAAHTVLLEPWLVLFTLLGAVLLFDGDRPAASRNRLIFAGVALGFAGAIEAWAVIPAAVLLVICLATTSALPDRPRLKVGMAFAGGVAGGFLVAVAPFALAAPSKFYQSVVLAQAAEIGPKLEAFRVRKLDRLYKMVGLGDVRVEGPRAQLQVMSVHLSAPLTAVAGLVLAVLVLIIAGGPVLLIVARRHFPTPLEWFALACTGLVTAMLLWPGEFYYHFAAFLIPFLALAIALPLTRIIEPGPRPAWAIAAAALMIGVFALIEADASTAQRPTVPAQAITAGASHIPPGSCVVSDTATLLLLANRFNAAGDGCTQMVDGLGTDLALSGGLTPETGAAAVPSVDRTWLQAFAQAQYLWLSGQYARRIPVTATLSAYESSHFRLVYTDSYGDRLYQRRTK